MRRRVIALLLLLVPLASVAHTQSSNRFAVAAGQALPTQTKFGLFPTVRLECYLTSPSATAGLLLDVYVTRAFPTTSSIRNIGYRAFRGTEYGSALSVVLQTSRHRSASPYVVAGVLWRSSSARDSTSTPPTWGVSWGTDSAVEPNVGVGYRFLLNNGHLLRCELRYYDGLVYLPFTVGLTL